MTSRTPSGGGPVGRPGRRIGDRRVRIELVKPQDYQVKPPARIRKPPSPALVLLVGFTVLIFIGTVLLAVPFASASGAPTPLLIALFTATSAVCVTGLVIVDTATHWSPFGQAVILSLVQIGGFGFMTGSTLLLFLLAGRRTALRDRLLAQATTDTPTLGGVGALIRRVAAFTVIVEAAGAAVLTLLFLARGEQPLHATISGVFHAISAFNNAGFDLTGDFRSLTGYADDAPVLLAIAAIFILGALGFAIVGDIANKRKWARLSLETKVVLLTTVALLVGGATLIGLFEWTNPRTLGSMATHDKVVNAFFTSATRTAGFTSIPTEHLLEVSLVILVPLMFIGGASGSTAGGIKVNTFGLLLIAIASTARGLPSAIAFGRRVPHIVVYRAMAVALLSIAVVFVVGLGLELTAGGRLIDRAFEAVSALGTVGLSTGLTREVEDPARLLLAIAMFVGRLGPLTLVIALTARARSVTGRPAVETMRIG
ncbi:MAG TPA: potassium transporter TrkG [Candidatus Limnocylindrales bacterium]|nr:potassium transporter TrkG [Candidatus Limnocylindrales bacterium]